MGQVDSLPNGFGVLLTKEYSYTGYFKDGDLNGKGLIYNYAKREAGYGIFKDNKLISGDVLPLKSTGFGNDRISLCLISTEGLYFRGICRNGEPGGLGYWILDDKYKYWGEFELIGGKLYNQGWGI